MNTYLVRLEVASETGEAARRSAAASTMPLHHRDGHHSRLAPRPLRPSPHHHHIASTTLVNSTHKQPSPPVWYLITRGWFRYWYRRIEFQTIVLSVLMNKSCSVATSLYLDLEQENKAIQTNKVRVHKHILWGLIIARQGSINAR